MTSSYHSHQIGGNQKPSVQLMNADQKWLETVFLVAICCQMVIKSFFLFLCSLSGVHLVYLILVFYIADQEGTHNYQKLKQISL